MAVQPTGSQFVTSSFGKFTWKFTNFTELLTDHNYWSRSFPIGGNNWRIMIDPKAKDNIHLSVYLNVTDTEHLPHGWSISAKYSLTVVNQRTASSSIIKEKSSNFCARRPSNGFLKMATLAQLCNDGFLLNDTLIIEASFPEMSAAITCKEMVDSYFSSLEQFISGVSSDHGRSQTLDEEVEDAKCLSDLFKLNGKEKLVEALTRYEVGTSSSQSSSVRAFWSRFGKFALDFVACEQENAEFKLQKVLKDEKFCAMKKGYETHLQMNRFWEEIRKREEECKRKMEEIDKEMEGIKEKKAKMESEWQVLMAESQEAKSEYVELEKKAIFAEKKKRVTHWRKLKSTSVWRWRLKCRPRRRA